MELNELVVATDWEGKCGQLFLMGNKSEREYSLCKVLGAGNFLLVVINMFNIDWFITWI